MSTGRPGARGRHQFQRAENPAAATAPAANAAPITPSPPVRSLDVLQPGVIGAENGVYQPGVAVQEPAL